MFNYESFFKPISQEERIASAVASAERAGHRYPSIDYSGPSFIEVSPGATSLSKEALVDKIKGALFGNAIGDAVGLYTEFSSKAWCIREFGPKGPIRFTHGTRGWAAGDWTDDTDQMILILDGLLAHGGQVDPLDFARRLKIWVRHGFAELGDWGGNGCGGVVSRAVHADGFLTDPHRAAMEVYQNSRGFAAANGAVMRTSVLGIPHFHDLVKVKENTKAISLTTHADPRCSASVVAATAAIAMMLQGTPCHTQDAVDSLVRKCTDLGLAELDGFDSWKAEFVQHMLATKLDDLHLDEGGKIGYTLKCVGSGFCLLRANDFHDAITELALEGGDADTNCAIAGALLGCKLGYSALPKIWLNNMPYRDWLMKRVDRFLGLLGLSNASPSPAVIEDSKREVNSTSTFSYPSSSSSSLTAVSDGLVELRDCCNSREEDVFSKAAPS